jgi:hypothetical protein
MTQDIEIQDWSRYYSSCEEVAYFFPPEAITGVEDYNCVECFYKQVEMPGKEEENV